MSKMATEKLIDKLTEEQVESKLRYADTKLDLDLTTKLEGVRACLKGFRIMKSEEYFIGLKSNNESYKSQTKFFKEHYGYESQELQKEYEEMLPEINKYLGVQNA